MSGCRVVEDIYNRHSKNEKYLCNEENLAHVAIVYSQQTAKFYEESRPWSDNGD